MSATQPLPIYVDRSRIVARQECPRLRYLNYHYAGGGIQRKAVSLPLLDGIVLHEGLAELTAGRKLPDVLEKVKASYQKTLIEKGVWGAEDAQFLFDEQTYLIEGILRGYAKYRLPRILEEYTPLMIEEEFEWPMGNGVTAMMRMDTILRHKDTGVAFIQDYKSLGYVSEDWMRKWEHDPQWLMYVQAYEDVYGEPCGGVLVEGLVKGQYRRETAKSSPFCGMRIQSSPYCYAYKGEAPGGIPMYQPDYTSKKGWVKVAGFQEMPAEEWFAKVIEANHLQQQLFIVCPPICPTPRERKRWVEQVVHAETQFASDLRVYTHASEESKPFLLEWSFPQHTSRCMKFGVENVCPYEDLCFNETLAEDPLADGVFEVRTPHHSAETGDLAVEGETLVPA